MPRPCKDPKLAQISKLLSEYKFKSLVTDTVKFNVIKSAMMSGKRLKNVCMMPTMTFSVRMYIGGLIRCLAFFRTDYHAACRMADLLVYRLGPRRFRYAHPTRDEYNFSEAQAKQDWETETDLHPIFESLEEHLTSINALVDVHRFVRKPTGELVIELVEANRFLRSEVETLRAELKVLANAVTQLYENKKATPV